ncbi:MAG TPA: hypothetical protein VKB54_08170 [Solirubrobacteraceae bacterium]|nr:hypothetical protein [Solirubrobacteraceae bacterium]
MASTYEFLPWVRRGLAATLTGADTLGDGTPGRATLGVTVNVTRTAGDPLSVDQQIALLGPGDVAGLDPRQVIRTDPLPGSTDAEPNYLVQAELDRPDLPWLFTPAAATASERLRPWLVLVVVAQGPGVVRSPPSTAGGLEVLDLHAEARPAQQLPDLGESWAWAHGQAILLPGDQLDGVLGGVPQRDAARLLCPRRLDPTTSYLACIVPAFEAGRRAGLGLAPDPADEAALRPAWTSASTSVTLPLYFAWEFTTGSGGDFESMVRALRPRPLPADVGRQKVYVGAGGAPLPAVAPDADGGIVELPGALVLPGSELPPWPAATRASIEAGLTELLDTPARRVTAAGDADDDPAVTPPLYGQWPAAQPTVPAEGARPPWLRTLNLDARHRAVAGLGAVIVEAEQERLMDEAWSQVGAVEQANRELRWAQVAREVRASLLRRHVEPLAPGQVLGLTAAVHRRLVAGAETVAGAIGASALPDALITARFRRTAAPSGALARRLLPSSERELRPIAEGIDAKQLRMGVSGAAPDGLFGFASAAPARAGVPATVLTAIAAARTATPQPAKSRLDRLKLSQVQVTPQMAGQVATGFGLPATASVAEADTLRDAVLATAARADAVLSVPADPPRPPLGVSAIAAEIVDRLDPRATVLARVRTRVLAPHRPPTPPERDPLEEIQAAPTFAQPVWELVRDHAPGLLLPGIARVPQDSATLAETNPAFAEAALVGLNHAVARELLWREYPTDQRGTCFARFWAPGGADDIPAIHTWTEGDLGDHTSEQTDGRLVLVLRGRLLFRYPHTVIYAAPDLNGRPNLAEDAVLLPTFRGRIEPDVAFCGFALTSDEARTAPGWWFVLEEQPTAPRFGLDVAVGFGAAAGPVNQWNDLTWGHLATDAEALQGITHLRADMQPPSPPAGPRWGATSSDMAAILAQQPVRVALRAADLLASDPAAPA